MKYRRIIITGPECSGKSTLSNYLSIHLGLNCVEESSVHYLNGINRPYEFPDLKKIAQLQNHMEVDAMKNLESTIICDTSFLVLYIWSIVRFGEVDPFIINGLMERQNDLFLLCKPDLKWVAGPHRENPHDRLELFNLYIDCLTKYECEYFVIQGTGDNRFLFLNRIVYI